MAKIKWNPPTLQDALDNSETFSIQTKEPVPGKFKYQCECGAYSWPSVMIDVRNIPGTPNPSMEFACDGCFTHWERNNIQIKSGRKPKKKSEWRDDWFDAHNAPVKMKGRKKKP